MFEKSSNSFLRLQELVDIINRLGPTKQQFVSRHMLEEASESQEALLYRTILSTQQPGERAVKKNLPADFNTERYERVKSELTSILLNLVFVLDLKRAKYSEYSQRLNELRKAEFLVKTLASAGARVVAMTIAEEYIVEARELEEWSTARELISLLRDAASMAGDGEQVERYTNESNTLFELLRYEELSLVAQERLTAAFASSRSEKPWLKQEVDKALSELAPALHQYKTFKLQWNALRLRKMGLQLEMKYHEALKITLETDVLLKEYPQFTNRSKRGLNAATKLMCQVQLQHFKEAFKTVQSCEENIDKDSNNWFYFKQLQLLLLFRSEQFNEAKEILREVLSSKRYNVQSESVKQEFQLFLLWADFLTNRPLLAEDWEQVMMKPGDITKGLLKLLPDLKDDYTGFKMSVIALEILLLLQGRRQKRSLIARIESLKLYRSRHLTGIAGEQASLFIRLLDNLIETDFDPKEAKSISQGVLADLKKSLADNGLHGGQIMSYAWLWNKILQTVN